MVRVDVPEAFDTKAGLKVQVTPVGRPLPQKSATAPLNPKMVTTLMLEVPELPAITVAGEIAEADIWNPGAETFSSVATPLVVVACLLKGSVPSPMARSIRRSRLKSAASARLMFPDPR